VSTGPVVHPAFYILDRPDLMAYSYNNSSVWALQCPRWQVVGVSGGWCHSSYQKTYNLFV
jgi:hypothetical protein